MPPEVSALVDRETELAALVSALSCPPAVAMVEGEAGIGKSHLVDAALADPSISRHRPLRGQARPGPGDYPLAPIVEALAAAPLRPPSALSPLVGALREVLPDHADVLPPAPPPLPGPGLAQHRLIRATAELLTSIGPTILVVEDAQWADEATIDLLGLLARHPSNVAVLVTYRRDEAAAGSRLPEVLVGSPKLVRVDLAPLSASGVARFAAQLLGGDEAVTPELADVLCTRSGGIPGLIRHDCRLLRTEGLIQLTELGWALASPTDTPGTADRTVDRSLSDRLASLVPPAVRAHVAHRTGRLSPAGHAILDALAVFDEPTDLDLLSEVTGLDAATVAQAAAEVTRTGLTVATDDGGTLGFRYDLARHTRYAGIPGPQRRYLHAAAAEAITTRGRPDATIRAVAHHRHSGDRAAWADAAEAAAIDATAHGDVQTAYRLLREALAAGAVEEDRRATVAVRLAWAALASAAPASEVTPLLDAALNPQTDAYGELLLLRWWLAVEEGATDAIADAVPTMDATLEQLARRPDLAATGLALLSCPALLPDVTLAEQERFLAAARSRAAHAVNPLADAAVRSATVTWLTSNSDPDAWRELERLPYADQDLPVALHVIRALRYAADAALHFGHHRRACDLAERGLRLIADGPVDRYESELRAIALRARWTLGEERIDTATSTLRAWPPGHGRLHANLLYGMTLTATGQLNEAQSTLRTTADTACQIGELAIASAAAAELSRLPDSDTDADQMVGRVLELVAAKGAWIAAAPLLPFGNLNLIADLLRECRTAADRIDAPVLHAAVSFADARSAEASGDTDTAVARYAEARHRYGRLPDPRLAAHATTAEMRCRLDAGQRSAVTQPAATELLREAWRTFTRLDATWDAERVKQVFRRAGLAPPHRRGRPGYGNRLSPREQEVAELAGQGHRNRDIAARLFLSERTVKYHVANAMRKLEVANRRQLAAVLASDGRQSSQRPARPDHRCRCARCGREFTAE